MQPPSWVIVRLPLCYTTEVPAGEVTSFALDEGICIAAIATSKNMLQVQPRVGSAACNAASSCAVSTSAF